MTPIHLADIIELDGALCYRLDGDPELFFPHPTDNANEAIAVCKRCHVKVRCLQLALDHETTEDGRPIAAGARFGIYGGMTPEQRYQLMRKGGDDAA